MHELARPCSDAHGCRLAAPARARLPRHRTASTVSVQEARRLTVSFSALGRTARTLRGCPRSARLHRPPRRPDPAAVVLYGALPGRARCPCQRAQRSCPWSDPRARACASAGQAGRRVAASAGWSSSSSSAPSSISSRSTMTLAHADEPLVGPAGVGRRLARDWESAGRGTWNCSSPAPARSTPCPPSQRSPVSRPPLHDESLDLNSALRNSSVSPLYSVGSPPTNRWTR